MDAWAADFDSSEDPDKALASFLELIEREATDDRLEIAFRRPRHRRSLLGAARPFIRRWPTQEEIDHPEQAWSEAIAEQFRQLDGEARG